MPAGPTWRYARCDLYFAFLFADKLVYVFGLMFLLLDADQ